MVLSPTAQRSTFWRPNVYASELCPLCGLAPETSDHVFSCPLNVLTAGISALCFREELAAALPIPHGHSAPLISDAPLLLWPVSKYSNNRATNQIADPSFWQLLGLLNWIGRQLPRV